MINSLLANIDRVKTPILFIMGNLKFGGVNRYSTIKKYYRKLKQRNIDIEYMYIKDEEYNFTKSKNMERILKKSYIMDRKIF
jgi:hypothetical protein